MPNYNYYKTISANLLVTSHDVNFLMGYLKDGHGVSVGAKFSRSKLFLVINVKSITHDFLFYFTSQSTHQTIYRHSNVGANHHFAVHEAIKTVTIDVHHR